MSAVEVVVKTAAGMEIRKLEEYTGESVNGKVPAIKEGTQVVYKNGPVGVYFAGKAYVDKNDPDAPFYYELFLLSGGHAPMEREKNLQPV